MVSTVAATADSTSKHDAINNQMALCCHMTAELIFLDRTLSKTRFIRDDAFSCDLTL